MTNFEYQVLREIAGKDNEIAFIGESPYYALEYLQATGYVTRGSTPKPTKKGEQYIEERELSGVDNT